MSLKKKTKNEIKKKFKKIVFKIIKPFIPFLIIILGIVFAVCTVVDSVFTTEDDMQIAEKLASEDYEAQYNEWVKEKEVSPDTVINDGKGLIPTGMFIWPIPGYITITSHFGMRTHPITGAYKLHSGTDVGAPIGVNFVAMADGIVTKANYNEAYGNMVMIDHRK
jgi:murein DD-endopeptidase MepM/ murein hydrolase activator NlpD